MLFAFTFVMFRAMEIYGSGYVYHVGVAVAAVRVLSTPVRSALQCWNLSQWFPGCNAKKVYISSISVVEFYGLGALQISPILEECKRAPRRVYNMAATSSSINRRES